MKHLRTDLRKAIWVAVALVLVLRSGETSSAYAAPLHAGGTLIIKHETDERGVGAQRDEYCPGDKVIIKAAVLEERPTGLFETRLDSVGGADILVNGWSKAKTDRYGFATWDEIAKLPDNDTGEVKFYIKASKKGSTDSEEVPISYTVKKCAYILQINYEESYSYTAPGSQGTFKEFAKVKVQGKLVPTADGMSLVTESGGNTLKGTYTMGGTWSFGKLVGQRYHCTPNDILETGNTFFIRFTATRGVKGGIFLQLSQDNIKLPTVVHWNCEMGVNNQVPTFMNPTFPTSNLIRRAYIGSPFFPDGFGEQPFKVPGGAFWANSSLETEGSVSLTKADFPK